MTRPSDPRLGKNYSMGVKRIYAGTKFAILRGHCCHGARERALEQLDSQWWDEPECRKLVSHLWTRFPFSDSSSGIARMLLRALGSVGYSSGRIMHGCFSEPNCMELQHAATSRAYATGVDFPDCVRLSRPISPQGGDQGSHRPMLCKLRQAGRCPRL